MHIKYTNIQATLKQHYIGVTVIETDVAAKSVVVIHDDNVTSADIDAKLQKVCYGDLFVANALFLRAHQSKKLSYIGI